MTLLYAPQLTLHYRN